MRGIFRTCLNLKGTDMRHLLITLLCFMATLVMQAQCYLGGDISLLPTYEAAGTKYYASSG